MASVIAGAGARRLTSSVVSVQAGAGSPSPDVNLGDKLRVPWALSSTYPALTASVDRTRAQATSGEQSLAEEQWHHEEHRDGEQRGGHGRSSAVCFSEGTTITSPCQGHEW